MNYQLSTVNYQLSINIQLLHHLLHLFFEQVNFLLLFFHGLDKHGGKLRVVYG